MRVSLSSLLTVFPLRLHEASVYVPQLHRLSESSLNWRKTFYKFLLPTGQCRPNCTDVNDEQNPRSERGSELSPPRQRSQRRWANPRKEVRSTNAKSRA